MKTRLSHRLAALAASTAVCAGLFSTVATSMSVAQLDARPHLDLPIVTVVASRTGAAPSVTYASAQAKPAVACANS